MKREETRCITGHCDVPIGKMVIIQAKLWQEVLTAIGEGYTHLIVLLIIAFIMVPILSACAKQREEAFPTHSYQHVAVISSIGEEECLLCGDKLDYRISMYMGQDNVGLVDLNTFDVWPVEINRYDENGQLIEESAGYMLITACEIGDTTAKGVIDPDRGFSRLEIGPSDATIDEKVIGSYLCQDCLDQFCSHFSAHDTVSEIAMINFATKEIRPLVDNCPLFVFDNFLVECDFEDEGSIDLRIIYRPVRYQG